MSKPARKSFCTVVLYAIIMLFPGCDDCPTHWTPIVQLPTFPCIVSELHVVYPDEGGFVLIETIENHTDRRIATYGGYYCPDARLIVTDSEGQSVPLTRFGEKRKEVEKKSHGGSHVFPGAILNRKTSLSRRFDFPGPGVYTVELSRRIRFQEPTPEEIDRGAVHFATNPEPLTFTVK